MKRFYSAVDWWLVVLLASAFGFALYQSLKQQNWTGLSINLIAAVFVVYLISKTFYFIEDQHLVIKSGFLLNIKVPVESIRSIQKSNNPLAAPAASLRRLLITTKSGKQYLISPKQNERREFIDSLLQFNSDIQVANQLMEPRTF